ncbi:MAG: DJ-1/PfpI family protein [Clostridia bacterium]|nr:DJ-1/PfpI family protein [Clostridia bacterium]
MVYIFLADGFEEIEALAPLDIMRRANIDVLTVGVTGEYVTGSHNITVKADVLPEKVDYSILDCVILPGGLPGTTNLEKDTRVQSAIDYANENNKLICAICAAPSILGHKGLLDGKEATCYPGFEDSFKDGKYMKQSVVKSDNFITSDGMGSAYKFGFAITAELTSKEVADKIREQIQY